MKNNISIPKKSLKRLAHYRFYLQQLQKRNRDFVSNERLAMDLNVSIQEIRQDLENLNASLSSSDIHSVDSLLTIVDKYLGNDQTKSAVIVGAGNLGKALLNYEGFQTLGLDIAAIFDNNENIIGKQVNDKDILSIEKLEELVSRMKIKTGIITTPAESAQSIADIMIEGGIQAIWNFSLAIIKVPDDIVIKNTTLYSDYLRLLQKLNAS